MREWSAAIAAIEEDLAGDVDVGGLARTALTSEYHFRRIFSSLAGMPVSEYVRRRRLTLAAADLLVGQGVLEVAIRYGYGSAEAFGRAFRAFHGLSPTEARAPGAVLRSQPRLRLTIRIEGSTEMDYRIVTREAFTLVGLKATVPIVYEGRNAAIEEFERGITPELRRRIAEASEEEPRGTFSATVALGPGRGEGDDVEYWRAAAVRTGSVVPEGLDRLDLPAGSWAVFSASGPIPEALQRLWADAATEFFPSQPYRWAPGPELLSVTLEESGTTGAGELWIPVERE